MLAIVSLPGAYRQTMAMCGAWRATVGREAHLHKQWP
jgi:hypothetical protein